MAPSPYLSSENYPSSVVPVGIYCVPEGDPEQLPYSEILTCPLDFHIQIPLLSKYVCPRVVHTPVSLPETDPSLVGSSEHQPNFKAGYSFFNTLASCDPALVPPHFFLEGPLSFVPVGFLTIDRVHEDSLVRLLRSEILTCLLDSDPDSAVIKVRL